MSLRDLFIIRESPMPPEEDVLRPGEKAYWFGEEVEVISGPHWPKFGAKEPPFFGNDPDKHPGARHWAYQGKPDKRSRSWKESNPSYLVRRPDGNEQYIAAHALHRDPESGKRQGQQLGAVVQQYSALKPYLNQQEHQHFLRLANRDARLARAYLSKKGVPPEVVDEVIRLMMRMK